MAEYNRRREFGDIITLPTRPRESPSALCGQTPLPQGQGDRDPQDITRRVLGGRASARASAGEPRSSLATGRAPSPEAAAPSDR